LPSAPLSSIGRIERAGIVELLLLALALGGFLRFFALGRREMSADEGASWAAAAASTITQVLQLQPRLNPGKFAVHEIALHGWVNVFGDGLTAMRALSAVAGTLAIAGVFFVARELFALDDGVIIGAKKGTFEVRAGTPSEPVAAFAAVFFAVNLVFIKYAQEVRMYSIALLCALMQVGFFLRSLRRAAPAPLLLTATFTALAIASTFTMLLILVPEGLWLAYLGWRQGKALSRRIASSALALIGGLALLIAPAVIYLRARAHAPALLAYAWASLPPMWAPISMFNKALGNVAFPFFLGLAFWGIARGWRPWRDALVFLLLWMLVPPTLVLAASYLIRPMFVERYLLASIVPFILLGAAGIGNIRGLWAQSSLLALVILLAVGHIYSYRSHPHDVQWREAVQAVTATTGRIVAVAPPYAVDVVRYYLADSSNNWSIVPGPTNAATAAIVADQGVSPFEAARISATCPRLLIRLRGVTVRRR
jgi:uncharacterized membrane protein